MTTRCSGSACRCYIAEMGTPGRLGVLEINEGRYRFRMLEGRLRTEEQAAIDARLAEFQARFPPTPIGASRPEPMLGRDRAGG